jgi:hypothetical protein
VTRFSLTRLATRRSPLSPTQSHENPQRTASRHSSLLNNHSPNSTTTTTQGTHTVSSPSQPLENTPRGIPQLGSHHSELGTSLVRSPSQPPSRPPRESHGPCTGVSLTRRMQGTRDRRGARGGDRQSSTRGSHSLILTGRPLEGACARCYACPEPGYADASRWAWSSPEGGITRSGHHHYATSSPHR